MKHACYLYFTVFRKKLGVQPSKINKNKLMDTMPYTYLIGWTKHNKFYYGVRYSKKCNPNDLWKTYFTSSEYVKAFRLLYGEPDIIEIRKTFNNTKEACLHEEKVLRRLKVLSNDKWLNKNISGAICPEKPKGHQKGEKNSMFGRKRPDLVERNKKGWSKETILKFSNQQKNQIWITKDNNSIRINKDKFTSYENDGWIRGRIGPSIEVRKRISQTLKERSVKKMRV